MITDTSETSTDASRFERLAPPVATESTSVGQRILSGLALAALLIGLPIALLLLDGLPPIPTSVPSLNDLARELGPADVLTVFVAIVWLLWLVFVVAVVLEIAAARRGGLATTIPLAGPLQHVARVLIGSVVVTTLVAGPASAVTSNASDIAPAQTPVASAVVEAESAEATPEQAPEVVEQRLDGELVYLVKAPKNGYHDNLWDIAERHLGDGFRYKEIYELNKDTVQADGRKLELARLIHPGWQLVMPADAVGVERMAAATGPEVQTAPTAPTDAADSAGADAGATAADQNTWWAGAGLLAAAALGALVRSRRARFGGKPDDDALELEAELRMAASDDRAQRLDAVLRHLRFACDQTETPIPAAHSATVGDDEIELHLAPAVADAVPGWEAIDDGAIWRFDGDIASLQTPERTRAALPGLVSLGTDETGRDVLIDVTSAAGMIAVGGDIMVAGEVVSSLAIQAGTSRWSDPVQVVAAGLPEGIDVPSDRLTITHELGAVLDGFDGRADEVITGREDDRDPVLIACGTRPEHGVLDRLGAMSGRHGLGTVFVGEHPSARWRITVDEFGGLHVPQLDLHVTANRIGAAQVEALAGLFSSAREVPDMSKRAAAPQVVRETSDAAWLTSLSRVGVLGDLIVDGIDADPTREDLVTEIVVYLAMHPEGVHPNVLAGAVWPLGVTDDVRDANIDRARAALGTTEDGSHRLAERPDGRLLLHEDVVCDWDAFCTLVVESRAVTTNKAEIDRLRRALKLVRGPAFSATPRGRYAWAAFEDRARQVGVLVVDAALRLAALLGDEGDPVGAIAAARSALRLVPEHQELWRIVVRSSHRVDGVGGVERAFGELRSTVAAAEIEPATWALISDLAPHLAREAS